MERKTKIWIVICWTGIALAWLMFWVIPFMLKYEYNDREIVNFLLVSFSAATALFTGVAFAATLSSLINQKKNLQKQVVMSVFSMTAKNLKDKKFLRCKRYIGSPAFNDDIKKLQQLTQKANVNLEDFKNWLKNESSSVDKKTKKQLSTSYYLILSFCTRMEYIGFLHDNIAAPIILKYYGRTILTTYGVLRRLIEIQRKDNKKEYLFFHYSLLYYAAKDAESTYLKEKEKKSKKFVFKNLDIR